METDIKYFSDPTLVIWKQYLEIPAWESPLSSTFRVKRSASHSGGEGYRLLATFLFHFSTSVEDLTRQNWKPIKSTLFSPSSKEYLAWRLTLGRQGASWRVPLSSQIHREKRHAPFFFPLTSETLTGQKPQWRHSWAVMHSYMIKIWTSTLSPCVFARVSASFLFDVLKMDL